MEVSVHDTLSRNGYNIIKEIGKGAFGEVHLVQDSRRPQDRYAIKRIEKRKERSSGVQNEIDIFHILQQHTPNANFIVQLHDHFSDENFLYQVLEYVARGTLANFRKSRNYFSEQTAKVFAMQIILGIEYIHHFNIVHRDVKPENVLIATNGYIKLADFGLAKSLSNDGRTYTRCGTIKFTAPEMIHGHGYGKGIDWWAVGVLVYEMLCGRTPFNCENGILYDECKYPDRFSPRVITLIERFLTKDPLNRLGCCQGHSGDIRMQEWFNDDAQYDWNLIREQQVTLPNEVQDLLK